MTENSELDGVKRDGNQIYFYADVDDLSCLELQRELRAADVEARTESVKSGAPVVPIILHILSGGGDLLPAFGIADQIARMKTPVHSIIEGVAASAGTLIAMACHKRRITRSSFMLIHQLSTVHCGTYEDEKDHERILDMVMKKLTKFYVAHSVATKKQVRRIMRRNSWFDAQTALSLGFVDEVV